MPYYWHCDQEDCAYHLEGKGCGRTPDRDKTGKCRNYQHVDKYYRLMSLEDSRILEIVEAALDKTPGWSGGERDAVYELMCRYKDVLNRLPADQRDGRPPLQG